MNQSQTTSPAARAVVAPSSRRARAPALATLLLLCLGMLLGGAQAPLADLREWCFDAYQRLMPRQPISRPAVVVSIDDASLHQYGQWPWPKTLMARLVDQIARQQPAALGVDILFAERDRTGPQALRQVLPSSPATDALLAAMPDPDQRLGQSFAQLPTVLAYAGLPDATPSGSAVQFLTRQPSVQRQPGVPEPNSAPYAGVLLPNALVAAGASSLGAVRVEVEHGIVRRLPALHRLALVQSPTDSTASPLPAAASGLKTFLPLELLRLATGEPYYSLSRDRLGNLSLNLGEPLTSSSAAVPASSPQPGTESGALHIPVDERGLVRVYFSRTDPERFVSAKDVLEGNLAPEQLASKLVLIGFTGIGLADVYTTPLGEREYGVEVHAQLLENVFDGQHPMQPTLMPWLEVLLTLGLGLGLIVWLPRVGIGWGALTVLGLDGLLAAAGALLFARTLLLFNAATPMLALLLLALHLFYLQWRRTQAQRRAAELALHEQRVTNARMTGELDAARKIQLGLLPSPQQVVGDDARVWLDARLESAREVGGDLYDLYWLDRNRLFFIVGDVSGKGLPASLCMAVTKALTKTAALKERSHVAQIMTLVNADTARENPQELFITAFAGVLNVETGVLEYCNAGHETPLMLRDGRLSDIRAESGGPPLCVIEDFSYEHGLITLQAGDVLLLLTDGVTEALSPAREPYGRERLHEFLQARQHDAKMLVPELFEEIRRFAAGAEQADDITVLALQWLRGGVGAPQALAHSTPEAETRPTQGEFPAQLGGWDLLLAFCEQFCTQANLDHHLRLRLLLVLEELFLNTVKHGFRGSSDTVVTVELCMHEARIQVRYHDHAPQFNPFHERRKVRLEASIERRRIGGLGLVLLKSLCREPSHHFEDGNHVAFFLDAV